MYDDQKTKVDRIGKKLQVTCECEEIICELGHVCISDCQNTKDCPCSSEHFCSMSEEHTVEECEGVCGLHGKNAKEEKRGEDMFELERGN